jgi:hypothetical protein
MQIVSCTKRNTGDSVDRTKGEVQQFEDVQVEEWDIVVDEAGASSSWIIANAPLPNFISPHPDNQNLRCTGEYQIRRVEGSPIHFQATVTYKGLPPGPGLPPGEDPSGDKKPEKRDREAYLWEWSTSESQEPIDRDVIGRAICTVNGEQFDPPLTEDVYDAQITFGKNVQERNQKLCDAAGKVNADVFLSYQAGQCKIKSVNYKFLTDPDTDETYWRQTVTILARDLPDPAIPGVTAQNLWWKRIRAEGYVVKNSNGDPVTARKSKALSDAATAAEDGNESPTPKLHNTTNGRQIDNVADAQWYYFETVRKVEFITLNII